MKPNLKISDFKLERYLTGDLPAQEMEKLRLREQEDEIFAECVKELRKDNSRILLENPFECVSKKMEEESGTERQVVPAIFMKAVAALVLAVGIFTAAYIASGEKEVLTRGVDSAGEVAMAETAGDTRIKGLGLRLEVWKKSGDSAVQMEHLGVAKAGDELQLRYSVPEKCYGLLFSMDGNGMLTVHLGNGASAVSLESGKMVSLPFAYKLDDAPRFEKFFLMTSAKAFAIDRENIDASLKQEGMKVVEFTVKKEN